MTDLTPEKLAEWDADAEKKQAAHDERGEHGPIEHHRIRTLIRALRDEKATREEAERLPTGCAWKGPDHTLGIHEWHCARHGDCGAAYVGGERVCPGALRAEVRRLNIQGQAAVTRRMESEARADKAEQELKAERARNRLIVMPSDPESKAQMEQLLAHLTGENKRALDAAEARVAELEAGINAVVESVDALNDGGWTGLIAGAFDKFSRDLRALTEKGTDRD